MVLVAFFTLIVLAISGILFLKISMLACVIALLIAVAGIFVNLVMKNKLKNIILYSSLAGGFVLALLCLILGSLGEQKTENGYADYPNYIAAIQQLVDDGHSEEALTALDDLEEIYGPTDQGLAIKSDIYMKLGDYTTAETILTMMTDLSSTVYYNGYFQRLYVANDFNGLDNMVIEAIKDNPHWYKANLLMGIECCEEGDYDTAEYYMLRAYYYNNTDCMTNVYLGKLYEDRKDPMNALIFYCNALENGAEGDLQAWVIEKVEALTKEAE